MAALAAPDAQALTLGRAFVQSQLGEAMRAEVEFESLTPEEADSLRATIVSAEGYRQVGIDYNPALVGARVVLQRLANAKPSLRVTTNRIVQEPFLELMVEVTWRGGRLVRSYTLLFDLPSNRNVATPAALSGATAGTQPDGSVALSSPGEGGRGDAVRPGRDAFARDRQARRGPPPAGSPPAPASVPDPYRVRNGDTLSEMAQRGPRPAGVSLDRLVLALYRDNPDAFLDGNMHRLRKGVVLKAPSTQTIDATNDAEARQIIRAQSADFNGYRGRLAAMPAERSDTATQRATGKVQAAVDDRKQSAAPTPDKLTLSKEAAARDAAREAAASKERERKDAAARVADLSKNVQDLGKLSSALGGASSASPSASSAATRPAPAASAAVAPGINLPSSGLNAPPAASAARPAPAPVATASAPASAPRPAAPAASAPPPAPAQPKADEPSFIAGLLDDQLPVVGLAGVLIALLAGVGIFKLVKRRREAVADTSFLESRLKPDSFFGASGAQHVDTREVSSAPNSSSMMNYSLSQLDAIGDVDPVAEADVYLAYGRDLQAEEILKEAKRTTPERLAIHTKLLEVYAKRRDVKGFEALAMELYATTHGQGDDWARACDMGRQIDPENDLYRQGSPSSLVSERTAPLSRGFEEELLGTPTQPQAMIAAPPEMTPPAADSQLSKSFELDLDLDLGAPVSQPATIPLDSRPAPLGAPAPTASPVASAPYAPASEDMIAFDGALDFSPPPAAAVPPSPAPVPVPAAASVSAAPADPLPFSTSAFSLDLDLPDLGAASDAPVAGADKPQAAPDSLLDSVDFNSDADSGADPLARKLELADEFRQIGDLEGARDLLQEVIDGASGSLKAKAEAMLAGLN